MYARRRCHRGIRCASGTVPQRWTGTLPGCPSSPITCRQRALVCRTRVRLCRRRNARRPPAKGSRQGRVLLVAGYGSASGYLFGFLRNLSFWPFSPDPGSSIAYLPGLPFTQQWHRYLAFDVATSLGWDTGRAVTDFVAILLANPAALTTFRRAARRANFTGPIRFTGPAASSALGAEHPRH